MKKTHRILRTSYTFIIIPILSGLIITATLTARAQPGSLDLSFGSGGLVTTDFASDDDIGFSTVSQSDGKMLVAGISNNGFDDDFALIRYNSDGSLDNTFGSGGKVTIAIGSSDDGGLSVLLQPDGKIVVAGFSYNGAGYDFALVRYNSDGSLDNTFGSGGKVTTAIGSYDDVGLSVAIQSDGKIVVAGDSNNGTDYDFALARYNSDGTLDNAFGSGGKVTTDFGSAGDFGYSVLLQQDGKIVVAGYSQSGSTYYFALVRYNSDGSLDNTFDSDGKVTTDLGSSLHEAMSVAIQSDGKIVAAGYSNNGFDYDFGLVRYNSDGSLDNTFGSGGIVTTAIGSSDDGAVSVAIQSDGKIVVSGFSNNGSDTDFALVRYNSDGSLDNTFGSDGKVTTAIGSDYDVGFSVAIQSDGKIVVAGYSDNGSDFDFAVARYHGGSAVGIAENIAEESTLAIFPNPFGDELFVKVIPYMTVEKREIIIFDVMGKEMMRQQAVDAETKISTEKLLPGFYFLSYPDGNKTATMKLVKF